MSVDGMIRHSDKGITYYSWKVFTPWENQMISVITTRMGGSSNTPLNSLNLGHLVNDVPEALASNRSSVSKALGIPGAAWAVANQIHGLKIAEVEIGKQKPYTDCDSLSITHKHIISTVVLADCLPIVIYDPIRHAGIISHAGWRGTDMGIAEKSVNHLLAAGSMLEDLVAAAGPGIGPCCYPVSGETARQFSDNYNYPDNVVIKNKRGEYRLNLEKANITRLRNCGLKEDNIGAAGFCTACRNEEFFSYRKEGGHTGRHAALMVLL
ncbi:MAG: peptidoglycan editing factor PgeF [Spirochaetaceae bacterium]|nr:peptidoglycan editing factor PgeF [Spirochaetaceae bacterium]